MPDHVAVVANLALTNDADKVKVGTVSQPREQQQPSSDRPSCAVYRTAQRGHLLIVIVILAGMVLRHSSRTAEYGNQSWSVGADTSGSWVRGRIRAMAVMHHLCIYFLSFCEAHARTSCERMAWYHCLQDAFTTCCWICCNGLTKHPYGDALLVSSWQQYRSSSA